MTGKRTGRIVRLDFWLRAGVVVLSAALLAAGEPVSPVDTSPLPTDQRSLDASLDGSFGVRACETDADCDDTNVCTTDACVLNICTHTTIPDCSSCTPGLICPPLDLVFVLDTSGSMKDEAMALCSSIEQIAGDLSADVDVTVTVLGITETLGTSFPCMTDNVVNLLGGDVPGDSSGCRFPDDLSSYEAWGPATAIVAERFPWRIGSARLVVPISDEGPCNGSRPDGCNDPGDDRDSVTNAIAVATARGVTVSPISGSGSDVCVTDLCEALAAGTGGTTFQTEDAIVDIPTSIRDIILQTCEPDPSCDDGDFCTRGDTCVDGACIGEPIDGCVPCTTPNGFCSDGSACTDDTCVDLECVSTPYYNERLFCCDPLNGNLILIPDTNSCTADTCDTETGDVSHDVRPDGETCTDGLFCNFGETCTGGVCGGGSPFDCSDLDDQCRQGVCDEDEEKCHSLPAHEADPCDDGSFCTVDEVCVVGICQGGSPRNCDEFDDDCNAGVCNEDSNACQQQPANEGARCDDGLFCSDNEVCREGVCSDGTPHDCSALNEQCARGICNEALDVCEADPILDGDPCDDGVYCTVDETCVRGVCGFGAPRDCSVLDEDCIIGVCVEDQQTCEPRPNREGLTCDDGLFCMTGELCTSGVCGGGSPRDCSVVDDDCSFGICDENSDACEREPTREGEPCDDGRFCTDGETCTGGDCTNGSTHDCSDLTDQCNLGVCDEEQDGCFRSPVANDTPCDDGRFCRVEETCNDGFCVGGHARDCSDQDADCTFGLCNEDEDFCEARPRREGRPCDDGNSCNVGELCQSGACIGGGTPDCLPFGDQCNNASCDPAGLEGNCSTVTPVDDGAPCDDELFCVEDESCQGGICGGGSDHDCGFLADQCNVGVCDDDVDTCLREPTPPGEPCDDGENCTYLDACDGAGSCTGVDLNETTCETSAQCPADNASCNTELGLCECVDTPELCFVAQPGNLGIPGVYEAGEEIVIHIALSPTGGASPVILGGQFFIAYDSSMVEVIDVVPGHTVDPSSPFVLELDKSIDPVQGLIAYAVGIDPFSGDSTVGPAVMAAVRLQPLVVCQSIDDLCFLPDVSPTRTWLVDENGANAAFVPGCCSGPLVIGGEGPDIVCPGDISVDADAGGVTALVEWDPLVLGGEGGLECTAIHDARANISHLIEAGGVFPPGLSSFSCAGTDSCGLDSTCDWTVFVSSDNVLEVTVELGAAAHCEGGGNDRRACVSNTDCPDGTCVSDLYNGLGICSGGGNSGDPCQSDFDCPNGSCAGPGIQRCIEFELFSTCVGEPLVVSETLEFGGLFNLARHAGPIELKIPAGLYSCASARDPLHTLRSASGLEIVDGKYVGTFTGDPIFGGNWLIGGNLDGDFQIGFLDFLIFEGQDQSTLDPNTVCGTAGPHADINGDGVVNTLDFNIVNSNIGATDAPGCCPPSEGADLPTATREISLLQLDLLGLEHLRRADLDRDGVLSLEEMDVYVRNRRLLPETVKIGRRPRR